MPLTILLIFVYYKFLLVQVDCCLQFRAELSSSYRSWVVNWFPEQSEIVLAFSNGLHLWPKGLWLAASASDPSLFTRDLAIEHSLKCDLTAFHPPPSPPHSSRTFLRVIRLIAFGDKVKNRLTTIFFVFIIKWSRPGRSLFGIEIATLPVGSLYALSNRGRNVASRFIGFFPWGNLDSILN
jgi:hypothetical protein